MRRLVIACVGIAAIAALTRPARSDEGMWPVDRVPRKSLKDRYGFEPSAAWIEHVQRSSVRIDGGSGSVVSADGLIVTNQHVGAENVGDLSTPERNLLEDGFYARTR